MRILAQWVPTTPEMEVKVLFGRHVWEFARQADALGKRAFELRAPLHYTLPAREAYRALLDELASLESAADRVAGFYDGACPALLAHFENYLATTDPLMDEPTVRILEGGIGDIRRMQADRDRLTRGLAFGDANFDVDRWRERQREAGEPVEHGEEGARARGVQP